MALSSVKQARELYLNWLNDAHAMEHGLIKVMEHQAKDAKDFPEIQARIEQHAEQTQRHAEIIEEAIKRNGGTVHTVKEFFGSFLGGAGAMGTGMFRDELIKNLLSAQATEAFEIACYTALVHAADLLGDTQTAEVCRGILKDEEEMLRWLKDHTDQTVDTMLYTQGAS